VFFHMAQVLSRAACVQARTDPVRTRELEIDQRGAAARADDHVLLLVQIVVAYAARMHLADQFGEALEEIQGEFLGL